MAKIVENLFLFGIKGSIGNQVTISKRGGQFILSQKIRERRDEPSEAQYQVQRNFKKAAAYAEAILEDQVAREAYEAMAEAKGTTAYRLAFTDMLSKPKIRAVDTSSYDGKTTGSIRIEADDDFSVTEVDVKVFDNAGALVEEGLAVNNPLEQEWVFSTKKNVTLIPHRVEVSVKDRPGNKVLMEQILN